ncbi:uncharacterized protein [Phyllobates terribilis]|uniref:uncharacterized protein n=1 Tax=Phyllobates terribilis TaxID=111132 RepID=UPI003CCA7432
MWKQIQDPLIPGNMKLHSGIFLSLLLWSNNQMAGAFDLSGPDIYKVLMGSDAILRCSFTMEKLPLDTQFLAIHWYFKGNQILAYDNTLNVSRPGLSINLQAAVIGDVSLNISKVKISDDGVYKCWVIYSPQSKFKVIKLDVQARPIVTIITRPVIKDEENTLRCTITGFYPSDITVTWLWGAEVIDTHEMYKPQRQDDGTYNVSSRVVIIPTDDNMNKTCTCRVTHVSLQFPLEKTFQLTHRERADVRFSEGSADRSYTTFIGLFIAIPVVLVLMVVLLMWWIWKHRVCTTRVRSTGNDEGSAPESQKQEEHLKSTPLRSSPKSPESATSNPSTPESTRSRPSAVESPESTRSRPSAVESPESTRSRPSAVESPESTRSRPSTPESPESTRSRHYTPESPESTRSRPSTPESPESTRSRPSTPESPESTRSRHSTPESPESTRSRPSAVESPESTPFSPSSALPKSEPLRPSPPELPVSHFVQPFVLQVPSKCTAFESPVSSPSQHSTPEAAPPPQAKCLDDVQQGFLQPRCYLSRHEHLVEKYPWGHNFGK